MKLTAIRIMGGRCQSCGWKGLPAGFEFHHVSGVKDFSIGMVSNKSWAIIKRELAKCVLLCRNCHAIEHCKHDDEKLLAEVRSYKGGVLSEQETAEVAQSGKSARLKNGRSLPRKQPSAPKQRQPWLL